MPILKFKAGSDFLVSFYVRKQNPKKFLQTMKQPINSLNSVDEATKSVDETTRNVDETTKVIGKTMTAGETAC